MRSLNGYIAAVRRALPAMGFHDEKRLALMVAISRLERAVERQGRSASQKSPQAVERGRRGGLESQRRRREKQQAEEAAWQAKVEAARLFRQGSR